MNNIEATTDNTAITSTEAAALAEAVAQRDPNTVTLDTPIKRGNGFITEVTLRKPSAGELRVSVVSAFIGAPVLIFLVRRKRGGGA